MKIPAAAILLSGLLFAAIPADHSAAAQESSPRPLKLLFLGDNGHHEPADRFRRLQGPLAKRRIELTYTDRVEDLNPETLQAYDGLILYANIDAISPTQAAALLEYVASGKGFIPLHCATYCFRNSPEVVALMGGQFQRHGAGEFSTVIADPSHPVMRGFGGFRSWDESYIHHLHNEENRTVLEYREEGPQAEGKQREPWTWVRTQGRGRVFYTAWGHDQRTWDHPGFLNLVERGIRWACGDDATMVAAYQDQGRFAVPKMAAQRTDVKPFEYVEVGPKIPNYPASSRWGVQEKPLTQMQQPLPPAESLKHYVAPEDFIVALYAAEPDLGGKPIAMTWDERGRLWVCETYDYPNELQPAGKGRDRIRICEDVDGDGRADKFTVFAEQLSIPTAITIYRGGAIVQNGTETLYLKDTDGDDRADLRQVLISGWALGDTHGGVSNFQYGLDNWIWAMQGYNNSTPEFAGAKSQSFRMGFFRFRLSQDDPPVVTELEFIRSTNNNTWGLGFSEEGVVFGSTANHNPSVYMPIANRYYERVRGWAPSQLGTIADSHLFRPITDKVRQVDQHGGYTAGAGHALYTARAWPQTWWNRTAFVCGPTGHLVGVFELRHEGADFQSTSPCNLIASDDEWSAPIMAEVGPDGQVWVLDWYNFIVQHNPTPQGFKTGKGNAYESDLRDKKHGRIYRVVYSGSAAGSQAAGLNLHQASSADLVDALAHPTMLWRKQAQRLLVERGADRAGNVLDSLIALCRDPSVDEVGLNVGAMHALWTLQGLGQLQSPTGDAYQAAIAALRHPSAGVRRNAVAVLPPSESSMREILAAGLTTDPDPQVRLASLLALADMPPSADAGQAIAQTILQSGASQRWISDACTSAAAVHAIGFLHGIAQSDQADDAALAIVGIVGEHIARGRPTPEQLDDLLPLLAKAQPAVARAMIQGLGRGWSKDYRPGLSAAAEQALVDAVETMPAASRSSLVKFANLLGSQRLEAYAAQIRKALGELVVAEGAVAVRADAADQLVALDPANDDVVELLLTQVSPQAPPELSTQLLQTLANSTSPKLGPSLARRSATFTPELRAQAMQVLLTRPATTLALLDAIDAGDATIDDLRLDQKQALGNHPNAEVRRRARKLLASGGGLPDPDRDRVLQQRLTLASKMGEVEAGRLMFKKHCAKCHKHNGEGENIGPDLTGMAVHPKTELLMHILDPSRSVEGNFRAYQVVTVDGRVISGMLAGESRTTVELIDTEAKRHAIPRADIEELISSRKSVMPEGFEKQMTDAELVDLLEFLTAKGKFVPLDLRKVASVISTRGMFYDENNLGETLAFPDWNPREFAGAPFRLVDPEGQRVANMIQLYGPIGDVSRRMPRQVDLPVNTPAKTIHFLSGVSGWGHPLGEEGSVSMIVRLNYADGTTEDHPLRNGVEFADYIRRIDVPGSQFAYNLGGRQLRYLTVQPKDPQKPIADMSLIKGEDNTSPLVMAITLETR